MVKIMENENLVNFISKNDIKKTDTAFLEVNILEKNKEFEISFYPTDDNSLLVLMKNKDIIEKIYQMTPQGKAFRINVPAALLEYINKG